MKPTAMLNAGGKKLPLTEFILSEPDAFQLIFPRPKDLSTDATLGVEFEAPDVTGAGKKVFAEFKLKKMLVDGSPQY